MDEPVASLSYRRIRINTKCMQASCFLDPTKLLGDFHGQSAVYIATMHICAISHGCFEIRKAG
ncbi:hypothetical protein Mal65_10950 [Crateriforma conspicua]|nr:hypothetical protein Mal65_10950 [Crateriforma conspicua]